MIFKKHREKQTKYTGLYNQPVYKFEFGGNNKMNTKRNLIKRRVTRNYLKIAFVFLFVLLAGNNLKLQIEQATNEDTIKKLTEANQLLDSKLNDSNAKVTELSNNLKSAEKAVMYQYDINDALNDVNTNLDKELVSLKTDNKKLSKELDNSISRLTTYEKYKYVVFNRAGKRTDVTYEQLKTGEKMMQAKGYDPNLLFGIVMVESTGKSNAYNRGSGATGYGQFMSGTGEFVYEKLLKLGTYNHYSTPKNGDANIKMMAAYLDYLYTKYDGNIVRGIREYCGGGPTFAASYIRKVDSYLPANESVYEMCKK
jgi:hypothetical protein